MRTTKRLFALLLALTLVFALCATAFAADFPKNTFTDVPRSAWYAEAVDFAQASGLMNGVGDNKFDPNGSVTRAMVATVLYRLADKPSVSGQRNPFRDVPNDAGCWFRDAAIWANKVGVTNGDGSADVFSPNKPITREQMASMIVRFLLSQADLDESSANMIKNLDANMAMMLLRDVKPTFTPQRTEGELPLLRYRICSVYECLWLTASKINFCDKTDKCQITVECRNYIAVVCKCSFTRYFDRNIF